LRRLRPGLDPQAMTAHLNAAGAPYGITFAPRERVSNSRLALEAAEFARDRGRYEAMHGRLFAAYFQEGRDIGDLATVLQVAGQAGLEQAALGEALARGTYRERLEAVREQGVKYRVTGIPTFLIDGTVRIVGAQPYQVFAKAVQSLL